jgi:hypothetical protein
LVLAAVALLVLLTLNVLWARPDYNWDVLPYVAVAYQFAGASPEQSHERTYALVQETLPAEFRQLTEANTYRSAVFHDPVAFNQQLPGYRIKVIYPWLMRQLMRPGFDPIHASVLISRVAYLAVGLVMLLWLLPWAGPLAAASAAYVVMSLSFSVDLAQLSTPDALSTLVVLLSFWLLFEKGRSILPLGLLVASVAVRPDNLLWLVAAALFCIYRERKQWPIAAATVVAGALLVFALGRWAQVPGWATVFHHAFVERVVYPRGFQPVLTPLGYLRVYLRETHPANLPLFLALFTLIGSSVLYYRVRNFGWRDNMVALLVTVGVFMAMHWLLIPDDDRYFIAAYLMIVLALLRTLVFARAQVQADAAAQMPLVV